MKIKVADYMMNFSNFKSQVETKSPEKRLNYAAEYSATSFVPVTVVYRFLTMIFGPSEEIEQRIAAILKFSDNSLEE